MRAVLTTERKIVAGFVIALVVLCVVAGVAVWTTSSLLRQLAAVAEVGRDDAAIGALNNDASLMVPAIRGFMASGSESLFTDWENYAAAVKEDEKRLSALLVGDKAQADRLAIVIADLDERMRQTSRTADPALLTSLWQPPTPPRNPGLKEAFDLLRTMDQEQLKRLDDLNDHAESSALAALVTIGLASALAVFMVVGAVIVIMRDLRNRRHAAEELERARFAAESASIAKSSFLANMSHELRTPLTSILGYADLLLDPGVSAERRGEFVQTMRRSGQQLLALINDILDVSKIEAGKMTIEHVECRLLEVLSDIDSLMRSRAAEKGLAFSIHCRTPVPLRVRTDPTRLRQILLNLVGNAVKFTDTGSARVLVDFREPAAGASTPAPSAAEDSNGHVHGIASPATLLVVEVVDTGIGISQEQQARIFQPFTQADLSTTRRFGGTGLGLSISRRLAALLGGSLRVQSELKQGSTFTLSLPMECVPGSEMAPAGDVERVSAGAGRSQKPFRRDLGLRVLLAEDGAENRDVIMLHLRRAGCEVIAAEDGRQAYQMAIEALQTGAGFDVVLMDMQMPVMDGYTATSQLRQTGYAGVIIALTAHAMSEDRQRCLAVGCDEYVAKPVEIPELLGMIARFCGKAGGVTVAEKLAADPVLRGLTRRFCEGIPETLGKLHHAFESAAWTDLAAIAHKLAGTGGAYGFDAVTREAKGLERVALGAAPAADVPAQLSRLEDACGQATRSLGGAESAETAAAVSQG